MTTRIPKKHTQALADLLAFARQRPGFDPHNYTDRAQLLADYRPVLRELHEVEALARQVEFRPAALAFLSDILRGNGRLRYQGKALEYTTGQYFPVEYRAACRAALASALWRYFRDYAQSKPADQVTGDDVRHAVKVGLGRKLARIVCA